MGSGARVWAKVNGAGRGSRRGGECRAASHRGGEDGMNNTNGRYWGYRRVEAQVVLQTNSSHKPKSGRSYACQQDSAAGAAAKNKLEDTGMQIPTTLGEPMWFWRWILYLSAHGGLGRRESCFHRDREQGPRH